MSNKNKGKSWEEIYGIEGAAHRRDMAKQRRGKSRKTKGKKWEDIYSAEEVSRRRQEMKERNPYHKLTPEQKQERNKKCSNKRKEQCKVCPIPKINYTPEIRRKMSEKKNKLFSDPEYRQKLKEKRKARSERLLQEKGITIYCKICKKEMKLLPSQYQYKKGMFKTFCNKRCQTQYYLTHDQFKYKANGWENFVIQSDIEGLKFVGDHKFWITLNINNQPYNKNPDFIVEPFSKQKRVIEIWGKRWHTEEEMRAVKIGYEKCGIKCFLLSNNDFSNKNKPLLKSKIEEWIKNDSQQKNS